MIGLSSTIVRDALMLPDLVPPGRKFISGDMFEYHETYRAWMLFVCSGVLFFPDNDNGLLS